MLSKCKISYTPFTPGWMLTKHEVKKNSYGFPKKRFFAPQDQYWLKVKKNKFLYPGMSAD